MPIRSQSRVQIRHLIVLSPKELLYESNTLPLVLKTDSGAIVEIGIANKSLTIRDKIGNLELFTFSQVSRSKLTLVSKSSTLLPKYLSD